MLYVGRVCHILPFKLCVRECLSMGSVFWTLMGLGAGMLLLSIIVGVVCCLRKKEGTTGEVISLRQEPPREGSALNSFSTSPRNTPRTPTAPNINSNFTHHTDRNVWTLSQTNETSSSNGNLRQSTNRATSPNHNINSVTNNTNTGTGQQARSQLNAQRNTEQPPSYESLPPSYSSLFNANS
ncbi:cap-specific mRNA (nucleoside-2'-O-)-methyltransferase 1-like isoform X1 [Ruditapes philippinarum]|uniref:cap-specific mRNA (nucleoside-2'-O-)-methyltransferase 1-like isoform X1 n=2 Tax=Ruditapes philippinarum TaxID=129788 RepID=UPI00295B54BC|nr:cap-specific mRNA (nucleoside-2'-O-)-methyltransferase 1-like isoform X1 [Ruditapes philippinarum]